MAAVVFDSDARGDFNTWSDIHVLVISDGLSNDTRARLDLLWRHVAGSGVAGGLDPARVPLQKGPG